MDKLEIQIIQECVQQPNIDVNELHSKYELDRSTLNRTLSAINQHLGTKLKIEGGNMYISDSDRDKCYRYLKNRKIKILAYYDAENRQDLLFLYLALSQLDMNLQELADLLLVSKNTALSDIKRLKQDLEEHNIYIKYSRKNGYGLSGSEFAVRNKISNVSRKLLSKPFGRYVLIQTGFIQENQILLLKNRLSRVQKQAKVTFTEESMEELPYLLQLLVKRAQKFNQNWHFPFEKYDIRNTKEYPNYIDIFRGIEDLRENDRLYKVLQILSATFLETDIEINESEDIRRGIDQFISFLENDCVMQFREDSELKEKLLLHLRPAIFRCLLSVNIRNPLTKVIMEEYRALYAKIREGAFFIERAAGCQFPDEEIAFITMIVISSMKEARPSSEEKTFTAIVLCRSGMSISKLLLENLRSMFPNIEFIGAYAIQDVSGSSIKSDFIFTTIPIHSEVTTFLIPSVLDKKAKDKIKLQVDMAVNQNVKMKTKELFSYLDDLLPDTNKKAAIERIEKFYQKDEAVLDVAESYFQLREENFSVIETDEWETVFRFAFEKLKERGSVDQHYIDAVFCLFQRDHHYMRIAHECYLPHAKPELGVLRPDFQFVLVKNKASLPDGSRMQLMVALAPSKENQHVEWLLQVNDALLCEDTRRKADESGTAKDLFDCIREAFANIE